MSSKDEELARVILDEFQKNNRVNLQQMYVELALFGESRMICEWDEEEQTFMMKRYPPPKLSWYQKLINWFK